MRSEVMRESLLPGRRNCMLAEDKPLEEAVTIIKPVSFPTLNKMVAIPTSQSDRMLSEENSDTGISLKV